LGLTLRLHVLLLKPFGISLPVALAEDPNQFPILFEHLTEALESVHENAYFHNDISPKNLLWDRNADRAFLSDFGLASRSKNKVFAFSIPENNASQSKANPLMPTYRYTLNSL
jgi:serine/threonine protein kinase